MVVQGRERLPPMRARCQPRAAVPPPSVPPCHACRTSYYPGRRSPAGVRAAPARSSPPLAYPHVDPPARHAPRARRARLRRQPARRAAAGAVRRAGPSAARGARALAGRTRARLRLGRRPLDGAARGWRGTAARLAPGQRVAPALLARRPPPRLRLHPHRRRRPLPAGLRQRRAAPPHARRPARPARRLVARRALALLPQHGPRRRGDERRLPRLGGGRHADARQRGALRQRVPRRARARRPVAGARGARHRLGAVVAPGQQPPRPVGALAPDAGHDAALRAADRGRRARDLADVGRRRPHALLRLGPRRRAEPVGAHGGRRDPSADALPRGARARAGAGRRRCC